MKLPSSTAAQLASLNFRGRPIRILSAARLAAAQLRPRARGLLLASSSTHEAPQLDRSPACFSKFSRAPNQNSERGAPRSRATPPARAWPASCELLDA